MKIKKSAELEKLAKSKYQEMVQKGLLVDVLDEKKFGKLSLFIEKKPKYAIANFEFDTHKVWVGAETI